MRRFRVGTIPCFLIVLAFGLASLQSGHAQGTPEASPEVAGASSAPVFLIEPVGQDGTYFTLEAEAGRETTLTVALGNAGEDDAVGRTYAADAYTLINGGFGINPEDAETTGATTWLDYEAETLDLAPGETVEREFTVAIPEGTAPGQYITGIVIQTDEPISVGGSGMLQQTIAKAIAVFISVPGTETPELQIGAASLKQTPVANSLQIELDNTGNVLLQPAGIVTVTTADGEQILSAPIQMGSFYAGTSTMLEMPVPTILNPGDYTVAVTLQDEETGLQTSSANIALTVDDVDPSATPVVAPVSIGEVRVDPVSDASGNLQVVNVTVPLANTGPPVPSARLTLHVLRDGEVVEDFPLNSSLVVASGETEIQQRYLPLTGWESGTYSFAVTLEAVDANTGQATVLANAESATTVDVP